MRTSQLGASITILIKMRISFTIIYVGFMPAHISEVHVLLLIRLHYTVSSKGNKMKGRLLTEYR